MTNFNIITSLCRKGGIGRHGDIPWTNSVLYTNMFHRLTRGNGNNAVLMGGNTYNYIWSSQYMPFHGRQSIIWSNNLCKDEPSHCHKTYYIGNLDKVVSDNKYDEVWIIGGEKMYSRIIEENIQIKNIYLNYIDKDYDCDLFFPLELFNKKDNFDVINKRIVKNVDQYIMKVER
jgi:dihydrofolate reductase